MEDHKWISLLAGAKSDTVNIQRDARRPEGTDTVVGKNDPVEIMVGLDLLVQVDNVDDLKRRIIDAF